MTEFWFGDIAVGLLTDKDTDISKEVVEKNFVDEPVQVYELTPDLESGSYSVIFLEKTHPRSESLSEQRDAVLSMPQRHVAEFPFEVAGDKGHVLVEQSNASLTPSEMIDEGEINIRFFEGEAYRPSFRLNAYPFNNEFNLGNSSVLALPLEVQNVTETEEYQISSRDGQLSLYEYSDSIILEYDRSDDFTSDERVSPCRLYSSDDKRIYSDKHFGESSYLENGIVRNSFGEVTTFSVYDSTWREVGSLDVSITDGYAKQNTNYSLSIESVEGNSTLLRKGYSAFRYSVSDYDSFTFNSAEDLTTINSDDSYRVVENNSGDELFLLRTSSDGNFNVDGTIFEVNGLDPSEEYAFFFGTIPDEIPHAKYIEYVYNTGNQERTLVQT